MNNLECFITTSLMLQFSQKVNVDLQLRIGIHTGNVIGSVVSLVKPRYLVFGPTSNSANYMESSGIPGTVNISW